MTLYIDTTNFNEMHFALTDGEVLFEDHFKIEYNENWKTLNYLDKFLTKHKVNFNSTPSPSALALKKVIVCSGPGSFNGTRVGITIAQSFGFSKDIPVIAITKEKLPKDLKKLELLKTGTTLEIKYTSSKFD